jgi:L-threonylcarbamoyladenylate synthase
MAAIGTDVFEAKRLLETGAVVGIPTETVYGLAGNAFDAKAVARIFQVKNRPSFDPLIVHSDSLEKISRFVEDIPPPARKLAGAFWPGALTLLLPKKPVIPDLVTAGLDTVAVRMPNHSLTRQLLGLLEFPLAAPSANPFGYISPTRAEHVEAQLGGLIPYILDGGPCQVGVESTIVGFMDGRPVVYRLGGLAVEAIEAVVGPAEVRPHSTSNPLAPGMLKSHYAPRKPLFIGEYDFLKTQYSPEQIGYLGFDTPKNDLPPDNQILLSPHSDYAEAARNLFAALRQLDALPVAVICAELLPEEDLGRAINDRIRRAAAK